MHSRISSHRLFVHLDIIILITPSRLFTGHNGLSARMVRKTKLAQSPTCNCGLEDQTAEHNNTAEMPASAESETKGVANSSPAAHQTLRQQGGAGEDGHSFCHLADWTSRCSCHREEEDCPFVVSN